MPIAVVTALHSSPSHTMKKFSQPTLKLIENLGVEGDAHAGATVKHRSRVRKDSSQPNLRQVHLIHSELLEELALKGFTVEAGQMGENITTSGIELLNLPKDTILNIGQHAKIQITGLRNPCSQLDGIQEGLMKALIDKDEAGNLIRKAGIMAIVLESGSISTGDIIEIIYPDKPFIKLDRV